MQVLERLTHNGSAGEWVSDEKRDSLTTKNLVENISTRFLSCGRWDLNPHDIAATRSLVLLVCQFRHFRSCDESHKRYNIIFFDKSQLYFYFFAQKNLQTDVCRFLIVRKMGLEPTRHCCHKILSLARLPIPTLPHACNGVFRAANSMISLSAEEVNRIFIKRSDQRTIRTVFTSNARKSSSSVPSATGSSSMTFSSISQAYARKPSRLRCSFALPAAFLAS